MSCGFVLQYPPYLIKKNDTTLKGNDRFDGFLAEVLAELSRVAGFTYSIELTADGQWGGALDKDGKMKSVGMFGDICHEVTLLYNNVSPE